MIISFHNNYILNFFDIFSLVKTIVDYPNIDNFEISKKTGLAIGKSPQNGKVNPTIKWAEFGGIITIKQMKKVRNIKLSNKRENPKPRKRTKKSKVRNIRHIRHIKLSDEGRIVYENDPHLRSPITSWFFHYHLSKPDPKSAWHYFIHKFLPERYEFTREDLVKGLESEFPNVKVSSINPGVLLNSYLKEDAMKSLNMIEKTSKNRFRKGIANIPTPFITGYIFAKIWERDHPDNRTVGFDALEQPFHLLRTMNIPIVLALEHLQTLSDYGLVGLMRSVKPFQLAKQWNSPKQILEMAYKELLK